MRQSQTVPFNPSNHQLSSLRPPMNQVQVLDPRQDIQIQNMMGVGLMNDFFKDIIDFQRLEDDFFSFSGLHPRLSSRGEEGTGYVMQVFSSVSSMGPDGQIKNEQYYENSLGHHSGGNTISERQQAYQNNLGTARIAEERRLNDQGRKVIKEKRGGQVIQSNHFYNLDEARMGEFDGRWNQVNNQTKFLETYGQMAPRQQLNFDTVNRLALQHQQQQAQQQFQQSQQFQPSQSQYRPQILPQQIQPQVLPVQPQTAYQTAINTPLLQSQVVPNVQSVPAIGPNRVSSVTSNTANTINNLSARYPTTRN